MLLSNHPRVVNYFPTFLLMYGTYFITEWVTKLIPEVNSVEVHPQLSYNGHAVDGTLVGTGSLQL
jgi:hypothetical protein